MEITQITLKRGHTAGVIAADCKQLAGFIMMLPERMARGEGRLLHAGRNEVRLFTVGGSALVVKRYKRVNAVQRVAYTFFRRTKARRAYDYAGAVPVLEHRGAMLNTGDGTLTYRGENIDLTKNEYRILLALMKNKGNVVSRERLMELLWEGDSFVDENTLTVNVNRLRKKLDGAGLKSFITTKFGVGYLIS